MRMTVAAMAAMALLAGCQGPPGSKDNPIGNPAILLYAAPGTGITLENKVNDTTTRTRITAGEAAGARGTYTDESGATGFFYPGCWGCGGEMVIDEEAYRKLWPLEKDKRTVFTRTSPNGDKARIVITVAGNEEITTPAGTYDTWILVGRMENLSGPAYSAQVRAWWAPGPGWIVRARGGDSQGNAFSSEVVDFDLF